MEQLTICIPTYNRKDRLLKQLESLYIQKRVYEVKILIIDNHSDYDVRKAICDHFGEDNVKNLTVHVNKVNLGLEPNICMPFLLADTKWIWTLGDDDKTSSNSIDVILNDIEVAPDCSGIIYSLDGSEYPKHKNAKHEGVGEFIDYLIDSNILIGDLVFLSSKVYNLDKVGKYVGNAFRECMNCVGHIVPFFYLLNAEDGFIITRSNYVVKYIAPEPGSGWKVGRIAYEFSLMSYMELDISEKNWLRFQKYIGSMFNINELVYTYLAYRPRYKGHFYFNEVYNKLLNSYGTKATFYHFIFEICYHFNLDLRKIVDFVKHR